MIEHFSAHVTFVCCLMTIGMQTYLKQLVGTLREAKKRKILTHEGELLLQGVHDNVEIILKPAPLPASGATTDSVVTN
uniref:Costars domain-containing protein n=1 Tax=Salix viminalis TaxID=40686 RepID=A0A6N2MGK0_SALVM